MPDIATLTTSRAPSAAARLARLAASALAAIVVACATDGAGDGEEGLLLGVHDGAGLRTLWLVMSDSGASVAARLPELVFPRDTVFWRAGVATLCHDDGTRQVVWQAPVEATPLVPGTPCPEPSADSTIAADTLPEQNDTVYVFHQPENCDASEAYVLFVSATHIAELTNTRQTEECEPRGGRYHYLNRVRSLDSASTIDLRALYGERALPAWEGAVTRAYEIVSREMNCPAPSLDEPDLESWSIERRRGRWHAVGIDNTWALCELDDTLGLPLPASIVGPTGAHLPWSTVSAAVPGLIDFVASPSGRHVVAVAGDYGRPQRLVVHAVKDGRPVRQLLEVPETYFDRIVSLRWARGREVRRWSAALGRIGAMSLPAPRDSTRAARPDDCAVGADAVLAPEGIGALRVGAPADSILVHCRVVRDTVRSGAEGMRSRILAVDVGPDTIEAEIDSARVWRLRVVRPALRTADSLGVGTALARLLEIPGIRGATGEGDIYALSPRHCGLSFRLAVPGASGPPANWGTGDLRRLPERTRVAEVLVIGTSGCGAR